MRQIDASSAPSWLEQFLGSIERVDSSDLDRFPVPTKGARASAVLILFGEDQHGPDLLLTERAHTMRSHAGQAAFPGGTVDPADDGPIDTALRESAEEVGLDPDGVDIIAVLPDLYIPFTGFAVTPVVGWWRDPTPVGVVDVAEVARVLRAPVADLTAPANRFTVSTPSGFVGPAFDADGLFVWGFTALLLDRVLDIGGFAMPWDQSESREIPEGVYRR